MANRNVRDAGGLRAHMRNQAVHPPASEDQREARRANRRKSRSRAARERKARREEAQAW